MPDGPPVRDPELRHTPNGIATCTFTLAVDRSFVRQGEERKADFIEIVAWRQTAEFVCKHFHKGSQMAVNGSLQTRSYQDKNGNKRTAWEVVAEGIHFAGGKPEQKAGDPADDARTLRRAHLGTRAAGADLGGGFRGDR